MSTFAYRIDLCAGYLYLWQRGLPTVDDLVGMQRELEQAAQRGGVCGLLTDNRELETPNEEVRGFMIRWMDQPGWFVAIALVNLSPMIQVRTNMDALARRAPRRSFDSVAAAEAWLRAQIHRRRRRVP